MKLKDSTITKGFIIAGLTNTSVLVFSRLFTNPTIPEFDLDVISKIWSHPYISGTYS